MNDSENLPAKQNNVPEIINPEISDEQMILKGLIAEAIPEGKRGMIQEFIKKIKDEVNPSVYLILYRNEKGNLKFVKTPKKDNPISSEDFKLPEGTTIKDISEFETLLDGI